MPILAIPEGLQSKLCFLGADILPELFASLKQFWPGLSYVMVADENTWAAAGEKVDGALRQAGFIGAEPVIFPANPVLHADYRHVPGLARQLQGKAVLAVGAGTINDLVKRASFEAECKGYLCMATAASVDGYTSTGAALSVEGFKQTLPCPAPLVTLADTAVLGAAPPEMTAAGYADLAAKLPAGADWFIADALGEQRIDKQAWDLVQKNLRDWLAEPEKLLAQDGMALQGLFSGLAHTGFAMQLLQDSRPASGAEHLLSHIWEMRGLSCRGLEPSHGFKVAIGSLLTSAMMLETCKLEAEELQRQWREQEPLSAEQRRAQIETQLLGSAVYEPSLEIAMRKFREGKALQERRRQILENWETLRRKIKGQLLDFAELKRRFKLLGCPVQPTEIGLDKKGVYDGIMAAGMIRNRYTVLDLLLEIGWLEEISSRVIEAYFEW